MMVRRRDAAVDGMPCKWPGSWPTQAAGNRIMSDPARGQEDGLDPEYVAITKRMCGALRDAATTLSAEFTGDEVEDCLMRWRIVLSILGADVVDGTVTLLEYGNLAPLI